MKKLFNLFLVSMSSLCLTASPGNFCTDSDGPSLKILSWNIQMLPVSLKKIGQFERAALIAGQLNESDYDVIVFQEAFDDKVRAQLSNDLHDCFPFQEGPANADGFFMKTNSGVWIVSKYPMKKVAEIQYKNCSGVDCFSRKGALMVELEKDGRTVQLVGTHLQAGDGQRKAKVRVKQYRQLQQELLAVNEKEALPQIICGDFNTPKRDKEYYEIMLNELQANDGDLNGEQQFTYDGRVNDMISDKNEVSLLDYIFLKNNKVRYHSVIRSVKSFIAKWHESKQDLSDHFAMEIILTPEPKVPVF